MWQRPHSIYLASYRGNWDTVREFLTHDRVDLNARGKCGYSALMWATIGARLDVVRDLLQHDKLDVHAKNIAGSTALDIARNCEVLDVVKCLDGHIKSEFYRQWDWTPRMGTSAMRVSIHQCQGRE
jgi:hypothetical protein